MNPISFSWVHITGVSGFTKDWGSKPSNSTKSWPCLSDTHSLASSKETIAMQWNRASGECLPRFWESTWGAPTRIPAGRRPEAGTPGHEALPCGVRLPQAEPARLPWGLDTGGSVHQTEKHSGDHPGGQALSEQNGVFYACFSARYGKPDSLRIRTVGNSVQKGGESRARQSQARRGLDCCETKPQVNIYLVGKELCLLFPLQLPGVARWPGQARWKQTPSGRLGSTQCWWPDNLAPKSKTSKGSFRCQENAGPPSLAMQRWSELHIRKHSKQSQGGH